MKAEHFLVFGLLCLGIVGAFILIELLLRAVDWVLDRFQFLDPPGPWGD